ncbi:nucleotidyltransferase family protein [Gorillibacterium sp. sgz5001074]|uniref:nucleotidyltransferase family protein n=1 Tax=Gorillibacterium sp. sgz5001074 TaxID=3446695 RepID=UPI003F6733C1
MESRLVEVIQESDFLCKVFSNASLLGLNQYYVGAGCITQTVWNYLTNRPLTYGIDDIDIVYFDDQNLSYEAEKAVTERVINCFGNIQIKVDVKNQARVHLWYENKFGIKTSPYLSLEQAIDTWPTSATALGVRNTSGNWQVYAPFGLDDLFTLTLRANKHLISEEIYYNKVAKWTSKWPELRVISW